MSDDERHPVMVYGSLKQGFGNNVLLKDQECLGPCVTLERRFTMISLGFFPGVFGVGGDHHILGELYEVTSECLMRLDALESNGKFYTREPVDVLTADRRSHEAWLYLLPGVPPEEGYMVPKESALLFEVSLVGSTAQSWRCKYGYG